MTQPRVPISGGRRANRTTRPLARFRPRGASLKVQKDEDHAAERKKERLARERACSRKNRDRYFSSDAGKIIRNTRSRSGETSRASLPRYARSLNKNNDDKSTNM